MTCDLCVIRNICSAKDALDNSWELRHAINYKFHDHCIYYIKDDIKELSLPDIDKIEEEVIE